jgi:hypothetical protein
MKTLCRVWWLLCFLAAPAAFAADAKSPTAPADPAKAAVAGDYAGTWKSSGSASGKLRVTLKPHGSVWGAEASFTYEETDVPMKLRSVKVDGTKVELVFDWDSRGTPAESKLIGEATGEKMSGTYESKIGSEPSQGTWTVTRTGP